MTRDHQWRTAVLTLHKTRNKTWHFTNISFYHHRHLSLVSAGRDKSTVFLHTYANKTLSLDVTDKGFVCEVILNCYSPTGGGFFFKGPTRFALNMANITKIEWANWSICDVSCSSLFLLVDVLQNWHSTTTRSRHTEKFGNKRNLDITRHF